MRKKLSIRNVDIEGKRILMRAELNVPLDGSTITSNHRIVSTLPTIQYCLNNGARSVVILSHIGKPGKQVSLEPVAKELEKLLEREIVFFKSCIGPEVEAACSTPKKGTIILLENVRFHVEEGYPGIDLNGNEVTASKEATAEFRKALSRLGDIFVNDAFGVVQRSHSSMAGINLDVRAAGLLMERELEHLSKLVNRPRRPFLVILGGAKVKDKIKLIENLLNKVDEIIIGGAMAFTFLKVLKNIKIGKSLFDEDGYTIVPKIMTAAGINDVQVHFPVDFRAAPSIHNGRDSKVYSCSEGIPDELMGLDCGPASVNCFAKIVDRAKTIFWNGPMGVFEKEEFAKGTEDLISAVAAATRKGTKTVIGGGDTGSACAKFGKMSEMSHVSTGGGASIAYLEGKELPGVNHLSDAPLKHVSYDNEFYNNCWTLLS